MWAARKYVRICKFLPWSVKWMEISFTETGTTRRWTGLLGNDEGFNFGLWLTWYAEILI